MSKWLGRTSLTLLLVAALCGGTVPGSAVAATQSRPNIVFVLTDDLADNLVNPQFTPNLWSLMRQGTSFSNYFVADSLCCPSRASIFTGRFPHDTGVYSNGGKNGGYPAFNSHGDETSTVATDLHAVGYRTAMMGKYLNEYRTSDPPAPGWDVWDVADWGYPEFNYSLNENGRVVHYGGPNQPGHDNYLTDVLSSLGDTFITGTVKDHPSQPFFLELATFAPHNPFTPAPKYAKLYPGLQYPKTPAFDAGAVAPPAWLGHRKPLLARQLTLINQQFRMRAQSMKSVDDMIGKIVATLKATGELSDTYFVFSSDNGLHMGDHRLMPGKLTAFETDIHVPLIMVGPGVRKGHRATSFAQNIDLRSTFDAFALTKPAEVVDGRSLVPLLSATSRTNGPPKGWPQGALIEHLGPVDNRQDPDYQNEQNANPPSYEALRLPGALYVEYSYGFREYYNLTDDPYELDNVYGSLSSQQRTALHDELVKAERCHNPKACAAPFETSS